MIIIPCKIPLTHTSTHINHFFFPLFPSQWPLLILDHQDKEHNVTMVPGEMVLYESARALHGRPSTYLRLSHKSVTFLFGAFFFELYEHSYFQL
jgi:hypothetical protein